MPLSELLKLYDIDQSEIGVKGEGQDDVTEEEDGDSTEEGIYHLKFNEL